MYSLQQRAMLKSLSLKKLYLWYSERSFWKLKNKTITEIFTDIYNNTAETYNPDIETYIDQLVSFIQENKVQSVLDIGCGDFKMMSRVIRKVDINYIGIDVVEDMIKHHQQLHGAMKTDFLFLDAIDEELPDAELVIIRQVLQHLSNAQIQKILSKLSKFKYVIITEEMLSDDSTEPNVDKIPGPHIRTSLLSSVFIDLPPFNVKNAKVLFEYFEEPTVIRTYLVTNP